MTWGDKQNAAIQRIHDELLQTLQSCNSADACRDLLKGRGWPCVLNAAGDPVEAVKATLAFYAIQARRRQLMDHLKAEHDKAVESPQGHQEGLQLDKAARKLGMPSRGTRNGPESLSSIMGGGE